jgi:quercetin dioxygenase-like cupin family protein
LACALLIGVIPSAASATPATGVSGVVLATGTSKSTVKVKNVGPTDVVVRQITIEPGGSTGWHYHNGQILAVVTKGTLTRTLDDCSVVVTRAGQTIVEPAGKHHVHIGRNLGTEPVELYATYVLPKGSPLAVDAPAPDC